MALSVLPAPEGGSSAGGTLAHAAASLTAWLQVQGGGGQGREGLCRGEQGKSGKGRAGGSRARQGRALPGGAGRGVSGSDERREGGSEGGL